MHSVQLSNQALDGGGVDKAGIATLQGLENARVGFLIAYNVLPGRDRGGACMHGLVGG
jgi:hypothetical protein